MSHESFPVYNAPTIPIANDGPVHLRAFRQRTAMTDSRDTPPSSPGSDVIPPEDPILRPPQAWHPSQQPRHSVQTPKRTRLILFAIFGISAIVVAITLLSLRDNLYVANLRRQGIPPGLYSKDGLLYAGTDQFFIKGLSWYGMEEEEKVPGGLEELTLNEVLAFMKKNKFNAIRLPLSVDNIHENGFPRGRINTFKNPQLSDMSYLKMIRYIVHAAASKDMLVLLDAHRLVNTELPRDTNGLWYNGEISEEKLVDAWKVLCRRFGNEWNVIGADLFNEPHKARWGSNDPLNDWKIASERLTETIHENCPSWLSVIQGVGEEEPVKENPFWAENLNPMYDNPPEVKLSQKVALSPHVYGPDTHPQDYFEGDDFMTRMPAIWDDHFGLAGEKTGFATIIGEWGGDYEDKDGEWQRGFLKYLQEKQMSSFYWCLNPESADTGGLLHKGWFPEEQEKLQMLKPHRSSSVADNALHFKHWRNWRTQ